ncbi:hypothetical protein LCGC14_2604740 [marine sediment metagenome]|uniref:Uncharacterized protein n=1 Tax=marine sediment metagenome TaxID=412755 RepID=A0A0F9CIN4_9ZZZZ
MDSIVRKSVCDKYNVHLPKGQGWALITVCEADGSVGIISDYGNWGYFWSRHGCESLKHFLIGIDEWYSWEKFTGGKKEYNHEKTLERVKEEIVSLRKENTITRVEAREMVDELKWMKNKHDLYRSDILGEKISEIYEIFHYDHDHAFVMFHERLWTVFVEHLKEEIKEKVNV